MELLWTLAAVVIVLYLAYQCSRFIAARGGFAGASGTAMRLLSRLPLAQDKQLVVVEAGGRYWLLGVSQAGIQLVAELTEEEAMGCVKTPQAGEAIPEFSEILRKGLSNLGKHDKHDKHD